MSKPLATEFWRITAIGLAALVAGLAIDEVLLVLLLAVVGYLAWHLRHVFRLARWLLQDPEGDPPQASGIWGEVFHRIYGLQQRHRKRERKMAALLGNFQEAATALPDGIVVLNQHDNIQWLNQAAEHLLRLHAPEDIGQHIGNLVRHPALSKYLAAEQHVEAIEFPSPVNQQLILSVRIVPYGRDQRLMVARDITRLHRLEQVRRDFVANVSHELRTPVTVISGLLETLTDAGEQPFAQWQRSLALMQQQSERMGRIVEDLLLLSRLETEEATPGGEPAPVAVLLAAIGEEARVLSGGHRQDIQIDADPGLWLRGNEQALRSAFANLVFNAVQYTPDGGRIDVRWFADEKGAHLEVQDTGIGIAPQHIPRLTERFYRVDVGCSRASGGTGLGLAIVKHVLIRHGATLEISSEPNAGSIFRCDFPLERIVKRNNKD